MDGCNRLIVQTQTHCSNQIQQLQVKSESENAANLTNLIRLADPNIFDV